MQNNEYMYYQETTKLRLQMQGPQRPCHHGMPYTNQRRTAQARRNTKPYTSPAIVPFVTRDPFANRYSIDLAVISPLPLPYPVPN